MVIRVVLTLVFLTQLTQSFAQKFLVLEKLGTHKRYEYHIGDEITFKIEDEDFFRHSVIEDVLDSVIIFDYGFFSFRDIESVNVRGSTGNPVTRFAIPLMVGGVILFLADQFNETVIGGRKASINKGVTIASGSLLGAGLLMLIPGNGIKKIKGNWRLRLVDI